MSDPSNNLALWDSVQETDPTFTKKFTRPGGFSGTAINATYQVRRATEAFGPYGVGWGVRIDNDRFVPGSGDEVIHVVQIVLWYKLGGEIGEVPAYGQTVFVGKNKNGTYTDEEAPKKSLTDAIQKALSMLGFSADVHLGMYDDNKYVAELKRKNDKQESGGIAYCDLAGLDEPLADPRREHIMADMKIVAQEGGLPALQEAWRKLLQDDKQLIGKAGLEELKKLA